MDSTNTFIDMFDTMNFGRPEVLIAVTMTSLVMLCVMFLVLSHNNNLWKQVDEEQTDNETLRDLKAYCVGLYFNMQNNFSANNEYVRGIARQNGLPDPTDEAVLYSKMAVEHLTYGLYASFDNAFEYQAFQDKQKQQKRAAVRQFSFKSTVFMGYAAIAMVMILAEMTQVAFSARSTTNQPSLSSVFEFATVLEKSNRENVTPAFYFDESVAITEWEGQALFQLLHDDEANMNTICCDDESETGSLPPVFEYAAIVEQPYGQG